MIEIRTVQEHVQKFLNNTQVARALSERDRDYKDHKQWTSQEIAKLKARGQAPIMDNRIKPKVEGLKGLILQRNTEPRAYARTEQDEQSSEVITDAFRYVGDESDFAHTKAEVLDNLIVEGYGGAIVDIEMRGNDVRIVPTLIPWDRIYFDDNSRRQDFKDAMYMGIVTWMTTDAAKQTFPEKEAEIDSSMVTAQGIDETFEDRPRFGMVSEDKTRIMVVQEFYLYQGQWHMCVFAGNTFLVDPQPSPYLDEEGQPTNPIELVHAYIDRDNMRYGEVRTWIDQQDMINHRQSKFLHMMSSRQTYGRKGAVDKEILKRELKKPDGHVEFNGNKFGDDFGIIPTNDMAEAQFKLLEVSKQNLDAISFNAQLSGERQGQLSGVAVQSLQAAGTLETNSLHNAFIGWQKRVFRQVWYRMKQHWTEEKWVRVTDDFDKLRWIGINVPVTLEEVLKEKINNLSLPRPERQKAAQLYMMGMQNQDPRMQQIVMTKNPVPQLDMDIIIDQGPDSINAQQEQFQMLVELAKARPEIPLKAILKMSSLRNKDDLIEEIEKGQQAAMQVQQQAAQLEAADKQVTIQGKQIMNAVNAAKVDETSARITNINMDSIGKQVANTNLAMQPDPNPQAVVNG